MSYLMSELSLLDFSSNRITQIDKDAFLNCRNLEILSIANNYLTRLTQNNFYYLFSLEHLNLSRNLIESIEADSFRNLNKLEVLDLNFNKLHSIENDLFAGLNSLKDLYLFSETSIQLRNQSFNYLTSLSNIFLNVSLVVANKCVFMRSIERKVQRNIFNRFVFFRSLNLITFESNFEDECHLAFNLLQFKIHFNLRSDYQNELFYAKCQDRIVSDANTFDCVRSVCSHQFDIASKEGHYEERTQRRALASIFSDGVFFVTMALLLALHVPIIYLMWKQLFSKKKADL